MKHTSFILVSDISGEELAEGMGQTVTFSHNGLDYSIDLTNQEAMEFEALLHPYLKNATRTGGRRAPAKRR